MAASPNLNTFDGQPHVIAVPVLPLQNSSAFRASDPLDLLNEARPPGLTGDPWEVTIYPGEVKTLQETLPRDTVYLGVLADFYNGPRCRSKQSAIGGAASASPSFTRWGGMT